MGCCDAKKERRRRMVSGGEQKRRQRRHLLNRHQRRHLLNRHQRALRPSANARAVPLIWAIILAITVTAAAAAAATGVYTGAELATATAAEGPNGQQPPTPHRNGQRQQQPQGAQILGRLYPCEQVWRCATIPLADRTKTDNASSQHMRLHLEAEPRNLHQHITSALGMTFWHGSVEGESGSLVRLSTDASLCIRSGLVIRGGAHGHDGGDSSASATSSSTLATLEPVAGHPSASVAGGGAGEHAACPPVHLRELSAYEVTMLTDMAPRPVTEQAQRGSGASQGASSHNSQQQRQRSAAHRESHDHHNHDHDYSHSHHQQHVGRCGSAPVLTVADLDPIPAADKATSNTTAGTAASSFPDKGAARVRQRRDVIEAGPGPQTPDHVSCTIFLDADASFLAAWGGSGTLQERKHNALLKMVDVLFQVDGLYQHRSNLAGILTFRIAGAAVHESLDVTRLPTSGNTQDSASRLLEQYQRWLARKERARGPGLPTSQAVCLNHLFTHTSLDGALGVAVQASTLNTVIGGLCESRIAQGRSLNAGLSTTLSSRGRAVATWQSVLSTAHELGHNVGASHTCDLSSSSSSYCPAMAGSRCHPTLAEGGSYLMYPAIALQNTHRNAHFFSPCSVESIVNAIGAKGACLQEEHPCSDSGTSGPCCLGHRLLAAGVVCRELTPQEAECKLPGMCTGNAATCPPFRNKEDSTPCRFLGVNGSALSHGTCSNGKCVHVHDAFCADLGLFGCSYSQAECAVACSRDRDGVCRPYAPSCRVLANATTAAAAAAQTWVTGGVCPVPTGVSCASERGYVGTCAVNGVCECNGTSCSVAATSTADNSTAYMCDFVILLEHPCNEPCDSGQQSVFYQCMCDDGDSRTPVNDTFCSWRVPPAGRRSCQRTACNAEQQESVRVEVSPSAPTNTLQFFLSKVADFQLSISLMSQHANTTALEVWACRSDGTGCLSASQLISFLADPSAYAAAQKAGYSVEVERIVESSGSDPITVIAIAVAVVAAVATAVALVLFVRYTRNSKDDDTDITFEGDSPRFASTPLRSPDAGPGGDGHRRVELQTPMQRYTQQLALERELVLSASGASKGTPSLPLHSASNAGPLQHVLYGASTAGLQSYDNAQYACGDDDGYIHVQADADRPIGSSRGSQLGQLRRPRAHVLQQHEQQQQQQGEQEDQQRLQAQQPPATRALPSQLSHLYDNTEDGSSAASGASTGSRAVATEGARYTRTYCGSHPPPAYDDMQHFVSASFLPPDGMGSLRSQGSSLGGAQATGSARSLTLVAAHQDGQQSDL